MNIMPHEAPYQHWWRDEDNAPGGRPLPDKIHALYCAVSYGTLNGAALAVVWVALRPQIPTNPYVARLDDYLPKFCECPESTFLHTEVNSQLCYLYAWIAGRASVA